MECFATTVTLCVLIVVLLAGGFGSLFSLNNLDSSNVVIEFDLDMTHGLLNELGYLFQKDTFDCSIG